MNGSRKDIDMIADITRNAMGLNIPVDLDMLCEVIEKRLQGQCMEVDITKLDVDAEISTENDNSKFVIRYRGDKPKTRILFSIAHELGHLFLDLLQPDGILTTSKKQRNMELSTNELNANEYAAAFLMPENEFIIKCKENMNDNKVNITKVAEYFGVSVQAATVRGNVLGLW
jgi:Zn-dependent peptidase ImmA (M78 family)